MKIRYSKVVTCGFVAIGFAIMFSLDIIRPFLILLISIGVYSLIRFYTKRAMTWRNWILPSYFFICILSLFHPLVDIRWIERGWLLIVFPLIIVFYKIESRIIQTSFYKGITYGAIAVGLANLIIATYRSVRFEEGSVYFDSSAWGGVPFWFSIDHYGNYYFSEFFSFFTHPSYQSLLISISVAIVILINPLKWTKRVQWSILFFLIVIIGLLSSRAGIIGLLGSLTIMLIFRWKYFIPKIRVALIIGFIGIAVGLGSNPRVINLLSNPAAELENNPRIIAWKSSVYILKEHWLLGVGLDRVQQYLDNYYALKGYEEHRENSYNAHNQFLESWMGMGVAGVLLLVFSLGYGCYLSYCQKNLLAFIFLFNIIVHFCFESMLNRAHGIIIFVLIYSIVFLPNRLSFVGRSLGKAGSS